MVVGLVFLVAFCIYLPSGLVGLNIFDEGIIVTGAQMAASDHLPYRDFLSFYGPAQYYLIGWLYGLFGEDLLVSRLAHVATIAALVPTVLLLSTTAAGERRNVVPYATAFACLGVALTCRPNPSYPAVPATLLLLIAAVFFGRWGLRREYRDLTLASVVIGAAALFRWDFGILALAAAAATVASLGVATKTSATLSARFLVAAIGPAIVILLAVYLPLVAVSDPSRWYREIVHYSLFEFSKYRNIEFLHPTYSMLAASIVDLDAYKFFVSLFRILFVAGPLTLVAATAAIAVRQLRRNNNDRQASAALTQSVFLAFTCFALFNQMRVRPSLFQGFPSAVLCLPLVPFVFGVYGLGGYAWVTARLFPRLLGLVVGAVVLATGLGGFVASVSTARYEPASIARARAIRDRPENRQYRELVSYVSDRTSPGEAVYSGVTDHSRLFANDALVYFLSNRPPATRFVEMDPGVANTLQAQTEIRDALEARRVRLLILLDLQSEEANLSSQSNGIDLLDRYIGERYRETARFGHYAVLQLR